MKVCRVSYVHDAGKSAKNYLSLLHLHLGCYIGILFKPFSLKFLSFI